MGYKNNNALSHYSMDAAIDMATRCVVRYAIAKACDAPNISVGVAVSRAVGGAVSRAVDVAVGNTVSVAVRDAVLDAVNDAVRSAVGYAVRDAVTEVEK